MPLDYFLRSNYPNPFNPQTTLEYGIPVQSRVELTIYNILGQQVRQLVSEVQPAGNYRYNWDGRSQNGQEMASGLYVYRLKARSLSGQRWAFGSGVQPGRPRCYGEVCHGRDCCHLDH